MNIQSLGLQPYTLTLEAMRRFTNERTSNTPDELWFLEHEPVYTLGQAGKHLHILNSHDIPVVHSCRGGQVTYHGPGQLIMYTLIDLKRVGLGIKQWVSSLEQTIIQLLATYGIEGATQPKAPGVYVYPYPSGFPGRRRVSSNRTVLTSTRGLRDDEDNTAGNLMGTGIGLAKIASLGLRVRHGCCYHGLSLNVAMDLTPFQHINPCGYPGLQMTQLSDFVPQVSIIEVQKRLEGIVTQP